MSPPTLTSDEPRLLPLAAPEWLATLAAIMKRSLGAKTLVYPTPVFVVGTYDSSGKPNVMTASWGGICCSQPPCVAVALRKATYTYESLLLRKAFTLSIASEHHVKQVDYFGLVSGRSADKFAATKLTPLRSKLVDAPYVKEFPLVLECKVVDVTELGLHTQFVGEVLDVKAEEEIIGSGGAIDIRKLKPLIFTPDTQDYYGVGSFVAKVFSAGKDI
jgi:flavin reductase (DIM6/NTAB) family NADH-FMN oxidoreductase RutF